MGPFNMWRMPTRQIYTTLLQNRLTILLFKTFCTHAHGSSRADVHQIYTGEFLPLYHCWWSFAFQVGVLPSNKRSGFREIQNLPCIHTHTNLVPHPKLYILIGGGGGEFMSTEFKRFMESNGIEHQLTAPHTSQQNGVVERTNHTIAGVARALLQSAGMPNQFWESAISTPVHVRNCTPSHVNNYVSPHEKLFSQVPNLSYLCVFGCLAYHHIMETQTKFNPTSKCLIFIGYEGSMKAYKLWDPKGQKFVITTDVIFEETTFPLCTETARPIQPIPLWEFPPKPKEYMDVTLPESNNEDNNIPLTIPSAQPSIQTDAPPQQQMTSLPDQTPVSPVQEPWRSTQPTWGIHRADPTNINPDREQLQQGLRPWVPVRYWSPMNLRQVHSTPPSSAIPIPSSSPFYFHHISDTPLFVPVPLVSSSIPAFHVSLISVPMSPWSSRLSHIVFLPHSYLSLFPTSTFVPSPWPSQADPAA